MMRKITKKTFDKLLKYLIENKDNNFSPSFLSRELNVNLMSVKAFMEALTQAGYIDKKVRQIKYVSYQIKDDLNKLKYETLFN